MPERHISWVFIISALSACGGGGIDFSAPNPFGNESAPSVKEASPSNGSSDVGEYGVVSVTFNKAMDKSTINETSFTLTDSSGVPVSGTVQYSNIHEPVFGITTGGGAVFIAKEPLIYSSTYTAAIAGAKDTGGHPLTNYSWTFTTKPSSGVGGWLVTATNNAPSARYLHTAIWTGNEMLIWGGTDLMMNYLNSGARYNPQSMPGARPQFQARPKDGASIQWFGQAVI